MKDRIVYPWDALRKFVLKWLKVEKNDQKGKQAVFDGAGTSIENDWDVTPYGEQK